MRFRPRLTGDRFVVEQALDADFEIPSFGERLFCNEVLKGVNLRDALAFPEKSEPERSFCGVLKSSART